MLEFELALSLFYLSFIYLTLLHDQKFMEIQGWQGVNEEEYVTKTTSSLQGKN